MSTVLGPADVVQAIIEARAQGDLDRALGFVAPESLDQGRVVGHADWRRRWERLRAADLEVITERSVESGEWVADFYLLRGAPGSGIAESRGMDMVRVVDGRLVEHWFFVEPTPDPSADR